MSDAHGAGAQAPQESLPVRNVVNATSSSRLAPADGHTKVGRASSVSRASSLSSVSQESRAQPRSMVTRRVIHDGASRHEGGLGDVADAMMSSAEDPWQSMAAPSRVQEPRELSPSAHLALLRALLMNWNKEQRATALAERVRATRWLAKLMQVSDDEHHSLLQQALHANSALPAQWRVRAAALRGNDTDPNSVPSNPASQTLLQPGDFPVAAGYRAWVDRERSVLERAIASCALAPHYEALLTLTVLSFRTSDRRRPGLPRAMACCLCGGPPSASSPAPPLHAPVVCASGPSTARAVATKNASVEASGGISGVGDVASEGQQQVARWQSEARLVLAVDGPQAGLTVQLRDVHSAPGGAAHHSSAARLPAEKSGDVVGQVSVDARTLLTAGSGSHTCKIQLMPPLRKRKSSVALGAAPLGQALIADKSSKNPSNRSQHSRVRGEGARDDAAPALQRTPSGVAVQGIGTLKFRFECLIEERGVPPADAAEGPVPGPDGPPAKRRTLTRGRGSMQRGFTISRGNTQRGHDAKRASFRSLAAARRASVTNERGPPEAGQAQERTLFVEIMLTLWEHGTTGGAKVARPLPMAIAPGCLPAIDTVTPGPVPALNELNPPSEFLGTVLPPRPTLHAMAAAAHLLRVRPAEQMLTLLHMLIVDVSLESPHFGDQLDVLEALLEPLAAAYRDDLLTTHEMGLLQIANGKLLHELIWLLERFHGVLLPGAEQETLAQFLRLTGLTLRFDPDPTKVAEVLEPYLNNAVKRTMLVHQAALAEAESLDDAVPAVVSAATAIRRYLQIELGLAPALPVAQRYLATAASYRYGLLASGLERQLQTGAAFGAVPYDDLLKQMEEEMLGLNTELVENGITTVVLSGGKHRRGSSLGAPEKGALSLPRLESKGVQLIDVDALIAPTLHSWIRVMSLNLQNVATKAIETELAPPVHRRWIPVGAPAPEATPFAPPSAAAKASQGPSATPRVPYTQSVVDLYYVLINTVDSAAARLLTHRPRSLAIALATDLALAVGVPLRRYVGYLEEEGLGDLLPAARAGAAAGHLPPRTAAVLAAHLDSQPALAQGLASPASPQPTPQQSPAPTPKSTPRSVFSRPSSAVYAAAATPQVPPRGLAWPPIITRQLAVKLCNMTEVMRRQREVEGLLATHMADACVSDMREYAAATAAAAAPDNDLERTSAHSLPRSAQERGAKSPDLQLASNANRERMSSISARSDVSFMSVPEAVNQALSATLSLESKGLERQSKDMGQASDSPREAATLPRLPPPPLPAVVQSALSEVARNVARSRQNLLAAVRDVFVSAIGVEVLALLDAFSGSSAPSHVPSPQHSVPLDPDSTTAEFSKASRQHNQSAIMDGAEPDESRSMLSRLKWRLYWSQAAASKSKPVDLTDLPRVSSADVAAARAAAEATVEDAARAGLELDQLQSLLDLLNREFATLSEYVQGPEFYAAQAELWRGVVAMCERLVLAEAPLTRPLTGLQVRGLRHVLKILRDHFHGAGSGLAVADLDSESTRVRRLFELYLSPTPVLELACNGAWDEALSAYAPPALTASSEKLKTEDSAASADEAIQNDAALGMQAQIGAADARLRHLLQVLRARGQGGDRGAVELLQRQLQLARNNKLLVLFDLPTSEVLVFDTSCTLVGYRARGRLYLASQHLCFSTIAEAFRSAADASGDKSWSLAAVSTALSESSGALSGPAVTLVYPLNKITRMAKTFVGRSRSLTFTLFDKSEIVFTEFEAGSRDAAEEAIRLHVWGEDTELDRHLRGLTAAAAPAALKLPVGEEIVRSYDCAQHSRLRARRGTLHVCSSVLLFQPSQGGALRHVHISFTDIESVNLSRGYWLGGFSVVITCNKAPYSLELCEVSSAQGEEMVALILDCVASSQ